MIETDNIPALILAIVGVASLLGVAVWDFRRKA